MGEFSGAVSVVGQHIKTSRISPVRLKAKMLSLLGDCFGKMVSQVHLVKCLICILKHSTFFSRRFGLENISRVIFSLGLIQKSISQLVVKNCNNYW